MESGSYEKILGSILLFLGLAIIGYALFLGVRVFVNGQEPPEIFKPIAVVTNPVETPAANSSAPTPKNLNEIDPADLQKMIGSNLLTPEMIKSIIPPETFGYATRLMNFSVFSLFLWVLITAGAKVSSLGIALIKTNSAVKV